MREGDGEAMKSRQKDRLGDEDGEGSTPLTCLWMYTPHEL